MRYEGQVSGVAATLEASSQGDVWSAALDVDGYQYRLEGHLAASAFAGTLIDLATGAQLPASGRVTLDEVHLDAPVSLTATRAVPVTGVDDGISAGVTGEGSAIDPRIAGVWLWTDAMASDGLAVVSQQRTVLSADGTFVQYDVQMAGAGLDAMPGEGGSLVASGYWRGDGTTLALSAGGPFVPTATYQTDGTSLLLTFADGTSQLWTRVHA